MSRLNHPLRRRSEAGSFSDVPEQRTTTCPIKAQSTAIARAMARICNAERVRFGVVSGHARKTLSLSGAATCLEAVAQATTTGLLAVTLAATSLTGWAQVAPTPAEVARYQGLHAAAHAGNLAQLDAELAQTGNTVSALNAVDGNGRTPLHVATFARHPDAVRRLIRAGARHDLLDADRYDAVTIAAVADDEATLAALLASGASARLTTSIYDGTALIAAAHLGHDGVVRQLIAAGAPLDHVNNLHWTAVIESIVLGNGGPRHQATLKALIDAGANLQLTDRQGQTPLQLARGRGYSAMMEMLVKAGAR